jgi:mannose-6-phosphate isomerase-like protein (cupin superfamily)
VTEEQLKDIGVLYYRIADLAGVDALAAERGYKNRDEITVSPEKMGDVYESKVKTFFHEHLHEDEEIRYIRGGRGFFDVRDRNDTWVRIQLEKDDLLILPAGIYHRFTTDETNVSCLVTRGAGADRTVSAAHPGHETLQGRTEVDAPESVHGLGCQRPPQGLCSAVP